VPGEHRRLLGHPAAVGVEATTDPYGSSPVCLSRADRRLSQVPVRTIHPVYPCVLMSQKGRRAEKTFVRRVGHLREPEGVPPGTGESLML